MGLTRRFLFNDASWQGQCASLEEFRKCIRFCLEVNRTLQERGGAGLEVGYNFLQGRVGYVATVREALEQLSQAQKLQLRLWVDRNGPFWDRPGPAHSADEYFECAGEVVTDTALAEAAHLNHAGEPTVTVSLPATPYSTSTLDVTWGDGPHGTIQIEVENAVSVPEVVAMIQSSEVDFENYDQLIRWVQKECRHLAVVRKTMLMQLESAFVPAVAKRGRELFAALNAIVEAMKTGQTARHDALCREWLTGVRMSDSSQTEKTDRVLNARLHFRHPCTGESVHVIGMGRYRSGFTGYISNGRHPSAPTACSSLLRRKTD